MSRIEKSRKSKIVICTELSDRVPVGIDANREHLEFPLFESPVHQLHFGHLVDTFLARRRPKIQEHQLAAVICELHLASSLIFNRKLGNLLSHLDDARLPHLVIDPITRNRNDDKEKEDDRLC